MMDDWEIKDIINRQTKTDIKIHFKPIMDKRILDSMIKGANNPQIELDIWAKNVGNKVVKYINCFLSGGVDTAKHFIEPCVSREGFEHLFSNQIERKVTIGDDDFVINIDRTVLLPSTSRVIGIIKIRANFIRDNCELGVQISTEDNTKTYIITGKEIIE